MKQRKVYDREFREQAVKLDYERSNLSLFAGELAITTKQLYSWRSQYKQKGVEGFLGKGDTAYSRILFIVATSFTHIQIMNPKKVNMKN